MHATRVDEETHNNFPESFPSDRIYPRRTNLEPPGLEPNRAISVQINFLLLKHSKHFDGFADSKLLQSSYRLPGIRLKVIENDGDDQFDRLTSVLYLYK